MTAATSALDVLSSHASVRSFTAEPVDDDLLRTALEAARRAPTSSNWQTYSIVVVRDPETKERLAELSGGQRHVAESAVFLAFVADFHRVRRAAARHGIDAARGLEFLMTPLVDAAIVGEATQVALESLGLGAVMVGGIRSEVVAVAELLGLPEEAFVVFGMSVGWPAEEPNASLKPRLPGHLVVHEERYSDAGFDAAMDEYDADLGAWYEARGSSLSTAAWTGIVARRVAEARYPRLRRELEDRGFRFD